ncbi:MAG: hypothetical protein M0008_07680 [Actinomycetota bacterium]|nr:hypothetical protein [Actinomycetota bacterium]
MATLTIRTRHKVLFVLLPLQATALVLMTVLEASTHLSVNPGPLLQADLEAWFGMRLAVLVLITAAAAAVFGIPGRFRNSR